MDANKKQRFLFSLLLILWIITIIACKPGESDKAEVPDPLPAPEEFKVFPDNNPWNTDISSYKVHPASNAFINSIGSGVSLHPNFGTMWQGAPNGIPYIEVSGNQKKVPINYTAWGDESDPGPFPIPDDAPVEGGNNSDGDRHVIVVDKDNHMLYELYRAFKTGTGWNADSGAKWSLKSNDLRPKYWTSADAAGLPIYPGLVRYDEILKGKIPHALRFTVQRSQRAFITPARHFASSSTNPAHPPMGLRLRLKASVDISSFSATNQIILQALKTYGMFVADNGSNWMLCGAPDQRWDDEDLHHLKQIKGNDFEVVYTGEPEY